MQTTTIHKTTKSQPCHDEYYDHVRDNDYPVQFQEILPQIVKNGASSYYKKQWFTLQTREGCNER